MADLRRLEFEQAANVQITRTSSIHLSPLKRNIVYRNRPQSLLSFEQLDDVSRQILERDFAYAFFNDGCYAKAHLISYELHRAKIQHSKVLIQAPEIGDIIAIHQGQRIPFRFHIAPVVFVETKQGFEPYVLDFSFFEKAVPLKQWAEYFYKNSSYQKISLRILGPEVISDDWVLSERLLYSDETLYRFENEILAFKRILKN